MGGYGSLNTGSAWFDDISMEAVTDAPAGAEVLSFDTVSKSSSNEGKDLRRGGDRRGAQAQYRDLRAADGAVCCWPCWPSCAKLAARPSGRTAFYGRCMAALLAVAFALRAVLAMRVRGYYTDVNCFTAWSEHIFSVGAAKFYNSDVWCDYPPGYMLMLWPVAALRSLFGLSTQSSAYLFRAEAVAHRL